MQAQYDKIGKDYIAGQKEFFSQREDQAIEFIKNSLPNLQNKRVLDVGCGDGSDVNLLKSLGAGEVYGVDISEYMVSQAKQNVEHPENIHHASIEDTPFEDNFFDAITSRYALHYLDNFKQAYTELSRILKKDGTLVLVVHHPMRDLTAQKNMVYGQKQTVTIELYDNKVPIQFPSHTLKEYFSDTFFNFFYLTGFAEEQVPEEYIDTYKTPGFMGIKAQKK